MAAACRARVSVMTKMDAVPEDLKVYAVTESGKIYWAKRNARGQFVNAYGRNRADDVAEAYSTYVQAQIDQAERETRGNMLTGSARLRGITVENIMAGRRSMRWAADELRDWLAVHGLSLRFREFRAQSVEVEAA